MKFRSSEGDEFVGRSYDDVVRAMADQKMTKPRSLETYRRATARRIWMLFKKRVSVESNRDFVESLVLAGLLEKVS